MRFPVKFLRFRRPAQKTVAVRWRPVSRIISLSAVFVLAALLQACSAVKLAYNQAPDLAYWYFDGYVDFTGVQSLQVKEDLVKLQAWHRQTQLPVYIDTLEKLQRILPSDISAAQACEVFSDVQKNLVLVSVQAEPALAVLAPSLGASQLTQLERKFATGNAEYRENFLDGTPKAMRNKRYKQTVNRAEMLYGRLNEKQLQRISQSLNDSGFSAELSYAERLRRQQDTLKTIRTLTANQANRASGADGVQASRVAIRALSDRMFHSPEATYRNYIEQLTLNSCASFASLHNSTSTSQRIKAAEVLTAYENDLKILARLSKDN